MSKRVLLLVVFSLFANLTFAQINVDSLFVEYEKAKGTHKAELSKVLIGHFEKNDYFEDIASSSNKEVNAVKVLLGMSSYCIDAGQFQKGIDLCVEAEKIISDKWGIAKALHSELYGNMCTSYFRLGKFDESFTWAKKQYKTAQEMKDDKRVSSALNNIAFIFLVTNRGDDAEKYINKAIAIERKQKNSTYLAMRLGTKSEILLSQNKISEAFDCINEAIELERKAGRMGKVGVRLSQKADVLIAIGDFQQARDIYEECIGIFKKTNNVVSHAITLKQLGIAEMYLHDYSSAEKHLLEGMELCRKSGNKQLLYNFYMCLHNLFCLTHETVRALYYCEQYAALYDTLMTEEHQQQLSEFEVKYKTQEKEKQLLEQQLKNNRKNVIIIALIVVLLLAVTLSIVFIKLSNERRRRNEELEKLNETKNRLFSIISHDLKNSVFSQKRMLDLINDNFDGFERTELKDSVRALKGNADSLNLLLLDLLQWALIDGGRIVYTPVRLELKELVDRCVAVQTEQASKKQITITHNVEDAFYVTEDAHFVEFVLRNLLSNAIKFSHSESDVNVVVTDRENQVELAVVDHGVGMCNKQLEQLFKIGMVSSKGTAGEVGSGLGLMVCKEMMDRSNGKIWAESEEGSGSKITFTLNK